MVKVSFWRLLGGVIAGFVAEGILSFAALYAVVGVLQERAFQPGSYEESLLAGFILMVLYAPIYALGTYLTVRIAGTKGFKVLIWVTAFTALASIILFHLGFIEVVERKGGIDWQNLIDNASPNPLYDYGNLVMMFVGLWLGRKWIKPEQLEFEKVKIESNSNYPRDDYQN